MLISRNESSSRVVLQNPYLLQEIFECLEDSPLLELCHAALTCRSFRKPAQDIIWRYIDFDLLPLIKLLSNAQYLPSVLADGTGVWCLNGPITPTDLEKVTYFASRVRHIATDRNTPFGTISLSIYVAIATALREQTLFPNLRHLNFQLRPPFFTFILHLLQSTRLSSIEISGSCTLLDGIAPLACDISTFIQNVASSPTLQVLRIATPPNTSMLNTISTFHNLRNLQLNMATGSPVDISFLLSISKLEQLQELNFDGASFEFSPADRKSNLSFPTLTHFLISSSLEDITDLFSFAKFPALYDLTHEFILPPESPQTHPYDWSRFLDALHNAISIDTFRELYVLPCSDVPTDGNARVANFMSSYPGIPFDTISESLLQFKLTYLSFNFPLLSSFTSDDLSKLMRSLPDLQTLDLRCASKGTVDTCILDTIAKNLPHLKVLTIDICAFTISSPPQRISHHPLEHLYVRLIGFDNTDVESVMAFALLVDAVFPYLKEIRDVDREEEDGMIRAVQRLQHTRMLERGRWGAKAGVGGKDTVGEVGGGEVQVGEEPDLDKEVEGGEGRCEGEGAV